MRYASRKSLIVKKIVFFVIINCMGLNNSISMNNNVVKLFNSCNNFLKAHNILKSFVFSACITGTFYLSLERILNYRDSKRKKLENDFVVNLYQQYKILAIQKKALEGKIADLECFKKIKENELSLKKKIVRLDVQKKEIDRELDNDKKKTMEQIYDINLQNYETSLNKHKLKFDDFKKNFQYNIDNNKLVEKKSEMENKKLGEKNLTQSLIFQTFDKNEIDPVEVEIECINDEIQKIKEGVYFVDVNKQIELMAEKFCKNKLFNGHTTIKDRMYNIEVYSRKIDKYTKNKNNVKVQSAADELKKCQDERNKRILELVDQKYISINDERARIKEEEDKKAAAEADRIQQEKVLAKAEKMQQEEDEASIIGIRVNILRDNESSMACINKAINDWSVKNLSRLQRFKSFFGIDYVPAALRYQKFNQKLVNFNRIRNDLLLHNKKLSADAMFPVEYATELENIKLYFKKKADKRALELWQRIKNARDELKSVKDEWLMLDGRKSNYRLFYDEKDGYYAGDVYYNNLREQKKDRMDYLEKELLPYLKGKLNEEKQLRGDARLYRFGKVIRTEFKRKREILQNKLDREEGVKNAKIARAKAENDARLVQARNDLAALESKAYSGLLSRRECERLEKLRGIIFSSKEESDKRDKEKKEKEQLENQVKLLTQKSAEQENQVKLLMQETAEKENQVVLLMKQCSILRGDLDEYKNLISCLMLRLNVMFPKNFIFLMRASDNIVDNFMKKRIYEMQQVGSKFVLAIEGPKNNVRDQAQGNQIAPGVINSLDEID